MPNQKRWQCVVCGLITDGAAPPRTCPTCGVDASRFVVFK